MVYSIGYVEIQLHRVSTFAALMYIFLFDSYLHSNIKSHQSNQTRSTTLRNLIGCQYSYNFFDILYILQYMYIYIIYVA